VNPEIKTEFMNLGADHDIAIEAEVERGNGNARHHYFISRQDGEGQLCSISFQNGPIGQNGVNGVQNEQLLAIVADRLISFQAGEYACNENQKALESVMDALTTLTLRTEIRRARSVEGKNIK